MIKGTKEGLTLHLNDSCSFEELKRELDLKLSAHYHDHDDTPLITVNIETGNRYLTDVQQEEVKELVRKKRKLVVEDITSNVITKKEAQKAKEEDEITSIVGIVRSGQVVEVPGDLLLVGDVNPGGMIMASGNIYVMGSLKGIAHAGCYGKKNSVIVASKMIPTQLRIANCLNRAPDSADEESSHEMECALINRNDQIIVDRLQVLKHLRPEITSFKGGDTHG